MNYRHLLFATILFAAPIAALAQTPCPAPGDPQNSKGYTLEKDGLQWCDSNSSGNNEGAACGAKALTGVNPTSLGGIALSNTWSRTNMMGAVKAAAKAGAREPAINAAICCQIHNDHMHACMEQHRNAVFVWLKSH